MAITKQCGNCNAQFTYTPPVGYADNRKYCDPCKKQKAAEWENRGAPVQTPVAGDVAPLPVTNVGEMPKAENKSTAMYVSYAKDIFIASISDQKEPMDPVEVTVVMQICINLVKQAREAFE